MCPQKRVLVDILVVSPRQVAQIPVDELATNLGLGNVNEILGAWLAGKLYYMVMHQLVSVLTPCRA